jgi:hypothetical protein
MGKNLIPLLKEPSGVAQFTFAIDFGATEVPYKDIKR